MATYFKGDGGFHYYIPEVPIEQPSQPHHTNTANEVHSVINQQVHEHWSYPTHCMLPKAHSSFPVDLNIVSYLCGTCPNPGHHSPLKLEEGEQVATHVVENHKIDDPMIPRYSCGYCPDQIFDFRGHLKDHLKHEHQKNFAISPVLTLLHLCMHPGCSWSHHLFSSEKHLSDHIEKAHEIDKDHCFLYMTSISHHKLIWERHHGLDPEKMIQHQTEHVAHVHGEILSNHTKILISLSQAIQAVPNSQWHNSQIPEFADINVATAAQDIRQHIIEVWPFLNFTTAISSLFVSLSQMTHSVWCQDEANYSFMCTVKTCEHSRPLKTRHEWALHMWRHHSVLMQGIQGTSNQAIMDLFMTPVSKLMLHASTSDNMAGARSKGIWNGAYNRMEKKLESAGHQPLNTPGQTYAGKLDDARSYYLQLQHHEHHVQPHQHRDDAETHSHNDLGS